MVYQDLLILALFILLYGIFATRIEKAAISGPILALTVGLVFGPLLLGIFGFDVEAEQYKFIAELALALVLFTDASKTNMNVLRKNILLPTRLLLIGLPLTIVFGMICAYLLFQGFSWIEVGILATMLAPTDAALGKAVVTNPNVPSKIREALNVESGLNDGISVPILFFFIAFFVAGQSGEGIDAYFGFQLLVKEIGIGLLVGLLITFTIVWLAYYSNMHKWVSQSWKPIIIIALSLTCFTAAQLLGGSGFIACFAGGFLYGTIGRKYKIGNSMVESAEGAGDAMSLITWVLFGTLVITSYIHNFTWEVVVYALLSLTVIRIIPVLLSLIHTGISIKEKLFIGWFGPRGLATIVFAVIVLDTNLPHQATIITTVVCTILFSVVLHGFTATPFIKMLKR